MTLRTLLSATLFALGATAASAAVVVDVTEAGGDVLFRTTGSLDLTGLGDPGGASGGPFVFGDSFFAFGERLASWHTYDDAVVGPRPAFGAAGFIQPDSGTGGVFGVTANDLDDPARLSVPRDYVSGEALSVTSVVEDATIDGLGLFEGSFVYTLTNDDTITLNIGAAAPIPLPAAGWLLLGGLGAMGAVARRRDRGGAEPAGKPSAEG